MKTKLTMAMERALYEHSKAHGVGIYGCFEVSLGGGYGNERVDYMTMDSNDTFRCYEIKESESDFNSKAKMSFYGDLNYILMPSGLSKILEDQRNKKYKLMLMRGVGVLLYWSTTGRISIDRKPKKRHITMAKRVELMHCMVRSLSRYCHYEFDRAENGGETI